jgi:hypothetical protein
MTLSVIKMSLLPYQVGKLLSLFPFWGNCLRSSSEMDLS